MSTAYWLKEIADEEDLWADDAIYHWPSIVAYEYSCLHDKCRKEQPYGVYFCIKDNFESFLKLEVLLAYAWADEKMDERFRNEILCQISKRIARIYHRGDHTSEILQYIV